MELNSRCEDVQSLSVFAF